MVWLYPQIRKGIPRTRCGKSPFADGSTVRFVLRDNIPQPMMDSDLQRAYISFRFLRLETHERPKFPRYQEFYVSGNEVISRLAQCLAACVVPEPAKGVVKNLVIRASNLGALKGWLDHFKLTIDFTKMKDKEAWAWYEGFVEESRAFLDLTAAKNPDRLAAASLVEDKPKLALVRGDDEADEAKCIDAVESSFSREEHLSNEWDGVHGPVRESSREAELARRQAALPMQGVVLVDKQIDLWQHLADRFPDLDWDEVNPVSGAEFFRNWSWCRKALKTSPARAAARTTFFMRTVYSLLHNKVRRTRKENVFQTVRVISCAAARPPRTEPPANRCDGGLVLFWF